jgi:hypothetical protein
MAFRSYPVQPDVRVRPLASAGLPVHLVVVHVVRRVFRPENWTRKDAANLRKFDAASFNRPGTPCAARFDRRGANVFL